MAKPAHLAKVDLERALKRLQAVCEAPYQWPPEHTLPNEGIESEADKRARAASNTTGEFSHGLFVRALGLVRAAGDELGDAVAKAPPGNSWER